MSDLKIGSLFSGYGGLDMSVEAVTGATPAWFCEWDDAPSRVLAHHWPHVPNHRDVTQIDWSAVEPVDIITGGYPCQPFSKAGHRKGTDDDRHLWPHILDAIRHIRPRYVFLENVAGHLSLGFGRVLADLASVGFDAEWTTVRASDVGAPHHRERLFILAFPADSHGIGLETQRQSGRSAQEVAGDHHGLDTLSWIGGAADIEYEAGLRWGDAGMRVTAWSAVMGDPPPVIVNHVAYLHPELFGTRFPEHKPGINPEFVEWMQGLPAGHVTGTPGLSRADMLKMIGNGVVPQQGAAALHQLLREEKAA